jgi:flagellar biosynthesis anti-sigma factor FlgM
MRIPDNQASGVGAQGVGRPQEAITVTTQRPGADKAGHAEQDQIQLSSLASSLKAESPGSVEREERIEQLRTQVAQGSYQPDAAKIGQSMIDDAMNPGSATPGQ